MSWAYCFILLLYYLGPPVNVAMAIEVASIDHISEANMVMYKVFFQNNFSVKYVNT